MWVLWNADPLLRSAVRGCTLVTFQDTGGCFTNVSRALQNILSKFVYCRSRTSYENFKLKLCTCAQSHALGTRTKFQLEILTINVISGIVYFREIILESSRNVSETTLWPSRSSLISRFIFAFAVLSHAFAAKFLVTKVFVIGSIRDAVGRVPEHMSVVVVFNGFSSSAAASAIITSSVLKVLWRTSRGNRGSSTAAHTAACCSNKRVSMLCAEFQRVGTSWMEFVHQQSQQLLFFLQYLGSGGGLVWSGLQVFAPLPVSAKRHPLWTPDTQIGSIMGKATYMVPAELYSGICHVPCIVSDNDRLLIMQIPFCGALT